MARRAFDPGDPNPPAAGAQRGAAPALVPWILFAYVVLAFAGTAALRLPSATISGNELGRAEALFEAINAITLTGLSGDRSPLTYAPPGNAIRMALMGCGLLAGAFITATAVTRLAGMRYSDRQVFTNIVGYTGLVVLIGAAGLIQPQRSTFSALFLSLSAFAHSGLVVGDVPDILSWRMHAILLPLMVLGGLGIPVLMELTDRLTGRAAALSRHGRAVVGLAAGMYLAGLALAAITWWVAGTQLAWTRLLAGASVASLNAAGVGLPVPPTHTLPDATLWVLAAIMLIGTAPGGAGSGLRTTSLAVLAGPVRAIFGGRDARRAAPPNPALGFALLWGLLLVALTGATFIALLLLSPLMAPDRALFNAISAATHTGLSVEPGTLGPGASIALGAAMLLARAIPWLLIWALVNRSDGMDRALIVAP